ncbi:nucleotide disphospho-sugar-binding domain-containing protein [Kitasatospora sp. NPDC056138]|uniref:nucleotide disphospho-sugar-binding domain-containing protein n=1 Tax=Kitasatospora sp. NPDC056138 TaxID=3345724 RepID=UPI0035DFBEA9
MRVLFTAPAAAGHIFPMVPTAQALRSAGHQVLFAGSAPLEMLRSTGLPVTEIGDGSTIGDAFRRVTQNEPRYVAKDRTTEEILKLAALGFAEHGRATIDGLLRLAADWRPDIVVQESFQAGAPLVTAKLGIPTVVHNFGVMPGLPMVGQLAEVLADEYRAHGLTGPAESTVLDVVPASLGGDGTGWRVRYVPFNGGGTVPADLLGRSERRRIAVTLGTVLTEYAGVSPIAWLTEQAAEVDADFLLAVGDTDLAPLGTLPDNIRPLPWTPLAQLLDASDAVIHHGGSGTMLTAAVAGVPQLILPQGADHFINADAAEARGFALRADSSTVDAALLTRLLDDRKLREAADGMQTEIADMPSPAALVADFEQLHRGQR